MTCILQISDLHFGTEVPAVAAALADLARQQKPDVLVLSGDITQRATASQFADARAFCDRLAIGQLLAIPGNHDLPLHNPLARLAFPYAAYKKAFGPVLEPQSESESLSITGVNTTRWWRHKNGEVSRRQIDRVCQQLARATAAQLRVVVVHQPVHVLRPQDAHDRLRGWQAAVTAWSAAGADIVMGGHIHLPYVCELSEQVVGLRRRLWCVQAGTAVSSRIRRGSPNSVNLVVFAPDAGGLQCRVERWDYSGITSEFERAEVHTLNVDRR